MPANERTPLLSDAQQVAQQVYPDLLHAAKVLGALQAGKLPSNAQLGQIIDILTSKTSFISPDRRKGESKLSANGQTILADLRDVLVKLKAWGEAKNNGDVLQELFFQARQASVDADLDVKVDVGESFRSRLSPHALHCLALHALLTYASATMTLHNCHTLLLRRRKSTRFKGRSPARSIQPRKHIPDSRQARPPAVKGPLFRSQGHIFQSIRRAHPPSSRPPR